MSLNATGGAKGAAKGVANEAPSVSRVEHRADPVPGICFREMLDSDLPEVLRVESSCYDFPWSEKNFRDCMNAGYLCYVADLAVQATADAGTDPAGTESGRLAGHGILMLGPGEAHVLNICVQPAGRRQGLARKFLHHLLASARQHEAREVFLEVRESNQAAICLYESTGFNQLTVRRGYYDSKVNDGGREDALIYAMTILPFNQVTI